MSFAPHELLRLRLRCDTSAPTVARHALAKLDAIRPVRTDALLVASELATNAVLHSGSQPGEELELSAELVPDGLRIEAADPGRSGRRPAPREARLGFGGIGLKVVEGIARSWGTERRDRVHVWAILAL